LSCITFSISSTSLPMSPAVATVLSNPSQKECRFVGLDPVRMRPKASLPPRSPSEKRSL
jgi:hypothetical protein